MNMMRKRLLLALVTAVGLAAMTFSGYAQEKQSSEAKVAVVNGTVISQADFDREMNMVQQRLAKTGQTINDSQKQALKMEVLERLINRELLYQASQNSGITIDETAVTEQLNALKERFPKQEDFQKALLDMKFSESYLRSQLRRDLAIKQFVDKKFAEKVTVSDKEAKSYFDSHKESFNRPDQIKASHILVKVDPQADASKKAEARKKIEEIQQKVKQGEDFAALAKEFSECPSRSEGGDLGFFGRGQMVKPFEDAAFTLEPGEVSNVVETKFGYHLIKCTDKKSKTSLAYKDVKEKLQQYLKQNRVQKEVDAYVEELRKKAKVEKFMT